MTMAPALTVAVTGGIGAGKSTVARMLAELGAVVVDSDAVARAVVAPGTPGLAEVAERFGPGVVTPDGALDRAALARIVFHGDVARRDLEAIIHPRVRAEFRRVREEAAADAIVVNDIPLVRSAEEAAGFDLVVTVTAPHRLRIARLRERGLAEDDARARIAAQPDDDERAAFTDHWIANDGDEELLRRRVVALWEDQLTPAART